MTIDKNVCQVCGQSIKRGANDLITEVCNCEERNEYFLELYGEERMAMKFYYDGNSMTVYNWFYDERNRCDSVSVLLHRMFVERWLFPDAFLTEVNPA